jgi:hypothetical protein
MTRYPGQSEDLDNIDPGDHGVCYTGEGFADQMVYFHSQEHQEFLHGEMKELDRRMNDEIMEAGQGAKDGVIPVSRYREMLTTWVADYNNLVQEWGLTRITNYLQSVAKSVVEEVLPELHGK